MADKEVRSSVNDSLTALKGVIQASNQAIPGVTVVAGLLVASIILVSIQSVPLMMAVVVLVVLLVSVLVFAGTSNYGEAALALVAGLLTAFTVSWTPGTFAVFVVSWFVFTFIALIISSLKLAAKEQDIYFDAAQAIRSDRPAETKGELQKIVKHRSSKMLGPIKCAEVLRLFAFRKLPLTSMQYGLKAVEVLSVITRVDHETVASFVADVYKMFPTTPGLRYENLLDHIYEIIRSSPVAPSEFISAFNHSRRIVLSGDVEPEDYFQRLTVALEKGVPPEAIYDYLRSQP